MTDRQEPLWHRTRKLIREYWPLGEPAALKNVIGPSLPKGDFGKVRKKIDACLEAKGGEVSARARAAELGEAYLVLNASGRRRFLTLLAEEYDVDNDAVESAIKARRETQDHREERRLTFELRNLLEPPRAKILRQFNGLRGGVKFLVDLRAELMRWAKDHQALQDLDQDLYRLLVSWFDIGFLELQRVTWNSSAALLEKFIQYEAVHEIRSWKDLKNRLEHDRHCYAFFHPSMPEEPLIFVEVALVNGIATNVHDLLDEKAPLIDPQKTDTAIFYSISNCQSGLAGVSFGNFLIKRVVADLLAELPALKHFATLSPIPGFSSWLENLADHDDPDDAALKRDVVQAREVLEQLAELDDGSELFTPEQNSNRISEKNLKLQQSLLSLCARYLLKARRGSQTLDRVAHFHLTNGARVKQINWAANLSDKGMKQSYGMMVNYLYDLSSIEKQHEAYRTSTTVSAAQAVRKLLK